MRKWIVSPYEAFRTLQGVRASYSSSVTAEDVFEWFSQQLYRTSLCSLDDVAAAMEPFSDAYGVMHYEGFLQLVLPGQLNDEWHRCVSLWRHCPSIFSIHAGSGLTVEVACRPTRLLDHESQERLPSDNQRSRNVVWRMKGQSGFQTQADRA